MCPMASFGSLDGRDALEVTPTTRTTWLQQRTVSRSPMRNSLRTSTPRRTLRFAAKAAKDSRTWEGPRLRTPLSQLVKRGTDNAGLPMNRL